MFVWTPALESLVPPRRGEGPPLVTRQMGRVRLFRAALKARATGYEPRPSLVKLMATGEGELADEADAFLLACNAPRRGTGVGKLSGLSEVEAGKVAFAGVDRWVQLRGMARAIEIFSLLGAWRPLPLFHDASARLLAAMRLRQWLAQVGDAAYDEALAYVERCDGLPHGMAGWRPPAGREVIAYLFPDHAPFFERAVAELQAHEAKTTLLLGAISSADDHARIAPRLGDDDLDHNALVIARVMRDAGLPILIEHARRSRRSKWLGVPRALTAYVSTDAARALATFADHRATHPILRDYFDAHPELADDAIAPLAQCDERSLRTGARALIAMFGSEPCRVLV